MTLIVEKRLELLKRESDLLSDFIFFAHDEECLSDRFLYLLGHALEAGLLSEIAERIGHKAYPIAVEGKSGWLLLPDSHDQKAPTTQGPEEPHSAKRIPESTQP